MKMVINDYESKDIIRFMREWTELTQNEFAKTLHRSRESIAKIETGTRNCYLKTFLDIANKHGIKVTLEKK